MPHLICPALLFSLLAASTPPASAPATTQSDPIAIDRQPPTVQYETINHATRRDRFGEHVKSLAEDAWCQSLFNCSVKLKYELLAERREPDGRVTVDAKIQRVAVTLNLSDTIYLPKPRTQKLVAHEEGHRRINERVYAESAESAARAAAEKVLSRTWTATAENADAAGKAATDQAVKSLADEYLKATANRAYDIGQIYDDLTDHGRKRKPTEDEAIADAFVRSQAHNQ